MAALEELALLGDRPVELLGRVRRQVALELLVLRLVVDAADGRALDRRRAGRTETRSNRSVNSLGNVVATAGRNSTPDPPGPPGLRTRLPIRSSSDPVERTRATANSIESPSGSAGSSGTARVPHSIPVAAAAASAQLDHSIVPGSELGGAGVSCSPRGSERMDSRIVVPSGAQALQPRRITTTTARRVLDRITARRLPTISWHPLRAPTPPGRPLSRGLRSRSLGCGCRSLDRHRCSDDV